jgi:endoglycosylceramidase
VRSIALLPLPPFVAWIACVACGDAAPPPTVGPGSDEGGVNTSGDEAGADAGGNLEAASDGAGSTDDGSTDAKTPVDTGSAEGGSPDAGSDAMATASPLVGHSGRWLLDAQGRVLIVHGLNVVNKLAPFTAQAWGFGDDDAIFLQAHGFNAVRLGVLWEAVEPQPGVYDATYVAAVRETEQLLASYGIYTLLDWHQDEYSEVFGGEGFPAWAVNTGGLAPASPHDAFPDEYTKDPAEKAAWDRLYADADADADAGADADADAGAGADADAGADAGANADADADGGAVGLQERLAAAEAYVAGQFAGDPWVLGYDVINEPSAGSASEPAADKASIGPLEQKLMRAARGADARHLVFYEPTSTFGLNGIALPAFGDPRAGISFHDYCFEPGSISQLAYAALCGGVLNSSQTTAISHAGTGGDAVLMTEFGSATPFAVTMVADDADKNMVPWLNWAYCGCGDPTTALDPTKEGIVIDPSQPLAGSNLNAPDLAVLERPYPQAIAGTPTSWSLDPTTGTFSLAYTTTSPPGATLAPGATTVVYIPAARYPSGYTATVTHGAIVAGSGTQTLSIAADPGAASVSVTVAKK